MNSTRLANLSRSFERIRPLLLLAVAVIVAACNNGGSSGY